MWKNTMLRKKLCRKRSIILRLSITPKQIIKKNRKYSKKRFKREKLKPLLNKKIKFKKLEPIP